MIQPSDWYNTTIKGAQIMTDLQVSRLLEAIEESQLEIDEVISMIDSTSQYMQPVTLRPPTKTTAHLPYLHDEEMFIEAIRDMVRDVHQTALSKGWYGPRGTEERNVGELIALCHSELSEALEAIREGNQISSKLNNDITTLEEELADCVIRIMDMAGYMGLRLGEAIVEKARYNMTRPHKHGKCF